MPPCHSRQTHLYHSQSAILCQLNDNDIDDDKMPGKSNFLSKIFAAGMIGLSSLTLCLTGCTTTRQVTTQTVTASDPSRWEKNPEEIARIRTAIAAEYIRDRTLEIIVAFNKLRKITDFIRFWRCFFHNN